MKKIFITGMNGFVGKHLVEYFANNSAYQLVGVDVAEKFTPLLTRPENIAYIQLYITDSSKVDKVFAQHRFDFIIHLAGILSKNESMKVHESALNVNFNSTAILLELAQQQNARFIFTSTAMVYGDRTGPFTEDMAKVPGNYYALTKSLAEDLILFFAEKYGLSYTIFRPAMLYGPGQIGNFFIPSLIDALGKNRKFEMTAGEQKRDFVYISDFIRAINMVMEKEISGTFNIGSGNGILLKDVAKLVEQKLGAKDKLLLGALSYRDHEIWGYSLSNAKFNKETGWAPTVNIETGIDLIIEYIRKKVQDNEN